MARQQGYKIRLTVFIPVDTSDIEGVVKAAQAVKNLKEGTSLNGNVPSQFSFRLTSRELGGDPDFAEVEEGQTDLEDAIEEASQDEDEEADVADAFGTDEPADKDDDEGVPDFLKTSPAPAPATKSKGRQKAPV